MATKVFNKEYLTDTLGLPYSNPVSDKIIDQGRWNIGHELIFRDPKDGKYYQCCYYEGATEMQPERPWEYDEKVECVEVKPCLVERTEYLPVEEPRLACTEEVLDFFRDFNQTEVMMDMLGEESTEEVIRDMDNNDIRREIASYNDREAEAKKRREPSIQKEKSKVPEKFV